MAALVSFFPSGSSPGPRGFAGHCSQTRGDTSRQARVAGRPRSAQERQRSYMRGPSFWRKGFCAPPHIIALLAPALGPASPADWAGHRLGAPRCELCTNSWLGGERQIHIFHILLPSQPPSKAASHSFLQMKVMRSRGRGGTDLIQFSQFTRRFQGSVYKWRDWCIVRTGNARWLRCVALGEPFPPATLSFPPEQQRLG